MTSASLHFSPQELGRLIHQSPTVQQMNVSEAQTLLQLAAGMDSPKARKLWKILLEEKARLEHVETVFQKIMKKTMSTFETGLIGIKKSAEKTKLAKLRVRSDKESSAKAKKILRSL